MTLPQNTQHILEASCFVLLCVLGVYTIPESFTVAQRYELSGSVSDLSRSNEDLEKLLRNVVKPLQPAASVQCQWKRDSPQTECEISALTRKMAQQFARKVSQELPQNIGWLSAEDTRQRMTSLQSQLVIWGDQVVSLEEELAGLEKNTEKLERVRQKAEGDLAQIQTELGQRNAQLRLIEEALNNRANDPNQAIFGKKRAEVAEMVTELASNEAKAREELKLASAPLERRRALAEELPRLRAKMDFTRAKLSAWGNVKPSEKEDRFPDLDTFQIRDMGPKNKVLAVRNWNHTPWAILLGLLVFFSIRGEALAKQRRRSFQTHQEVVEVTGLRFLGYWS